MYLEHSRSSCAGLALGKAPVHQNDIVDVATMLDTNCKSLVVLTQQVAEGMVTRNWVGPPVMPNAILRFAWIVCSQEACFDAHWCVQGHIINVSSIAAHDHYAGGSVYCGTKAFVTAFTNATRHDLVGTNVRCVDSTCLNLLHLTNHSTKFRYFQGCLCAGSPPFHPELCRQNSAMSALRYPRAYRMSPLLTCISVASLEHDRHK